ncbi:MAG: uracil-DNA glycosylase family protein, partial [Bacteroidales bacterium]|nr:uracil-DNA glycosylase family protein [Bacteroidales bacterium]
DTLRERWAVPEPKVGENVAFTFEGRPMRLWRMPSSSRAYPMKLEKKAAFYARMLQEEGLLTKI